MWKVENYINEQYLEKFEAEIIIPVFNIINEIVTKISLSQMPLPVQSEDIWKHTDIFKKLTNEKKSMYEHFMCKKVSGEKLQFLIYSICTRYSVSDVKFWYNLYLDQNREVDDGNYDVAHLKVCELFKKIFTDFYYSNFFVDEKIWNVIIGGKYNRKSFHENFRRANNNRAVCSYCDIDTVVAVSNNNIEHFLPKSKYPFLAMNPKNLISSCTACNKAHEGKGDRVSPPPIVTPFHEMIGGSAEFRIDFLSKSIKLENVGSIKHDNYFKLLKLYSRYSEEFIYDCVDDATEILFQTLSNYSSPSKKAINEYISMREGKVNLSFALKSAIKYYPQYQVYK